MRTIVIVIAIILWVLLGYFVKNNDCFDTKFNCADKESAAVVEEKPAPVKKTGPLLFNWNKEGAITGDGWNNQRQSIINGLKDDEILEITGQYRADETNKTTFENLGVARASEIAKLFKPPLTDERIRLRGQLVNAKDSEKIELFKSATFRNLKNSKSIKEIDDRTLIYFPFNSTNKLKSKDVEAYLDDVAERVKKSGERVRLSGHTDSVSSEESNLRLGQRRADIVKNYLVAKGVSSSKIIATSKGEMVPANGAYVDNKESAQNRRTELEIIK